MSSSTSDATGPSRSRVVVGVLVLALAGAGAVSAVFAIRAREHVVHVGSTYTVVDGRHLRGGVHQLYELTSDLFLIGNHCLGLVDRGGNERVVVWPHGTTLGESNGVAFVRYRGERLAVGSLVGYGVEKERSLSGVDLPNGCSGKRGLVIYSPEQGVLPKASRD
jgi:hypothetical protein